MTRAEKVTEAQRLRAEGLSVTDIAKRMGVPRSTASTWLSDPDLSRQRSRREGYSRPCVDCGNPTDGSGGFAVQHERCLSCRATYQHDTRTWTRETIIAAIQSFAAEVGHPPSASDWNPPQARAQGHPARAERFLAHRPEWPHVTSVLQEFGTWANAIEAAGFPRPRVGAYDRSESARRERQAA